MSMVETYSIRVSGVARINDDVNVRHVSLPRITAFGTVAEQPPLPRKVVTPIRFIPADREARLAMIHAAVSKARRAGLFDHCLVQP